MNTPAPPDTGSTTFGLLLRQVRDALWQLMEQELAGIGHELNFSQYITLKKLAIGTAGVTDLARAAQLNPGAMTRLLDKLEARGYVTRETDPADRRALHIHLTEAGAVIAREINHCGQRVLERAFDGLDANEREQLLQSLGRVRDNLSPTGS